MEDRPLEFHQFRQDLRPLITKIISMETRTFVMHNA